MYRFGYHLLAIEDVTQRGETAVNVWIRWSPTN